MKYFIFPLILFLSMCTDKYQQQIFHLEHERDSLRQQYSVLSVSVAVNEQRVREAEIALIRADSISKIVTSGYQKQIAKLKQKSPKQIHEEFNETFPTNEEPLVYVSNDQILSALVTKLEKDQCLDLSKLLESKITSLSSMVSLKDAVISDKDKQIELLKREVSNSEALCSSKIALLEDSLRQEKRKAKFQKIGIAAVAVVLLLL